MSHSGETHNFLSFLLPKKTPTGSASSFGVPFNDLSALSQASQAEVERFHCFHLRLISWATRIDRTAFLSVVAGIYSLVVSTKVHVRKKGVL